MDTIMEVLTAAKSKNVSGLKDLSLIIFTDGTILYVGSVNALGAKASLIHPVDLGLTFISSTLDLARMKESLEAVKGKKIDPKTIVREVSDSYTIPYEKVKSIKIKKPWIPGVGKAKLTVRTKDGATYEYILWLPKARAETGKTYRNIIKSFTRIPKLKPLVGGS
ncbi:MAG: hypothetical protein J7L55_03145 [Desulfurococcales archaeon]|nr:hypothetical protein [Desulfurococcales archaeon]